MVLGPRFTTALAYAAELHGNQMRKGTEIPYVSHILAVTAIVIEYGGDEDQAIAACLHDAVEDQGGSNTLFRISERYGQRVAKIVEECSDTDILPKPEWHTRKENYIASIKLKSKDTILVSLADKIHNVQSIIRDYQDVGELIWNRFNGGRDGTLWYYRELAKAYKSTQADQRMSKAFEVLVSEIDRLASESS